MVEQENFYKDLDPILDEINKKCVKMDSNMKKQYVNLILEVVHIVIKELRSSDEVFNKLYSKLEYVGSYFDGLRVAKPTEFDLNLIMKMPCDYKKILVENTNVSAGFVKVNIANAIINNQQPEAVIRTVRKWCDPKGYLLENKVRQWMEGVITCCLGQSSKRITVSSGEIVDVKFRKCGPAFTLNVNTGSDVIDVDLVFTIQFPETIKPPSPIRWNNELAASWVVVPKPSDDPCFWRVSFSYSERIVTQGQYKLKLINRFLKALRDAQDWQIPSYFVKSMFLWEAHECSISNRSRFWEKRQGYLFIYMLDKMQTYLNACKLSYYWHKKMNLFNKLGEEHAKNRANQISRILSKMNGFIINQEKDKLRNYILVLFNVPEELAIADLSLEERTGNGVKYVDLNLPKTTETGEKSSCCVS